MSVQRPPRFFRGWWVVVAVFTMLTVGAGTVFYGLSVYLEALAEQGLGVGGASFGTTAFFAVSGLVGVLVARMLDRTDARLVVAVGALVTAVALVLLGRVESTLQALGVYALLGAGFAASSLVPGTTLVTRWFSRRRALALSVASTGLSFGGVAVTPVIARLVDDRGLREVSPYLALVYVLGIIPVTALLLRDRPSDFGLLPDGDPARPADEPPPPPGVPYEVALHDRTFKAITVAHLLAMAAQVGALAHLYTLVTERLGADAAAGAVSVLALLSLLGRLAGGVVMTKLPLVPCYVFLALVQAGALLLLGLGGSSAAVVFPAVVVFGITVGNLLMLHPLLLAEAYGVADYARLYSRSSLVATIGIAGGPLLIGAVRDALGGYGLAFVAAAACSVAAAPVLRWGARRHVITADTGVGQPA